MVANPLQAYPRLLLGEAERPSLPGDLTTPLIVRSVKPGWPTRATAGRIPAGHETSDQTARAGEAQREDVPFERLKRLPFFFRGIHNISFVNIEMIVARLAAFGKLGGFHFNDSKYGD